MHDCVFTLEPPWKDEDEDGPKRGAKWVMQFEWARASVGGGRWQGVVLVEKKQEAVVFVFVFVLLSLTSHLHPPPRNLTCYTSHPPAPS